jgi:GT2 family glycosyltransferase
MDVSIIIINWNSKGYLKECLKTLPAGVGDLNHEIIVIDNGSYDGTAEMLASDFPHVRFVQGQQNLGFAAGNNRAAKEARGELLLFLNPDTESRPRAIKELTHALRSCPGAGIAGARLFNSDLSLQTSCVQAFPTILNCLLDCEFLRRIFPKSSLWGIAALFKNSDKPSAVETVSGACLMIKREVFDSVGGFDEHYFMYTEDRDLCFKVHLKGFACLHVPTSTVVHHGGGSSRTAPRTISVVRMRESIYRFMRLRRNRFAAGLFRFSQAAAAVIRIPLIGIWSLVNYSTSNSRIASLKKWASILLWSLGIDGFCDF